MHGGPVMCETDVLDPDAPEFAGIRAQLARVFIQHKADMAMADWSDETIVHHVTDIAAVLIALGKLARESNDTAWLLRHRWWYAATKRLFDDDEEAAPLDS
jgi:hypothetical protein